MRLTIGHETSEEESLEVSKFLDTLTTGTVHQSWYWPRLNPPSRRQSYLYFKTERDEGELLSAGLVRQAHIAGGYNFAVVKRGPATRRVSDLKTLLPVLESALHSRGALSLTVNPYWLGDDAEEAVTVLKDLGYSEIDRQLQNMPTATAIIGLEGTKEDLMASFNASCRTKIRASPKKGIQIYPVDSKKEAKVLTECLLDMVAVTQMDIDSQHDFVRHYEFLSEHPDRGCVLVASLNGEPFGGMVNFREGTRGILHILATRRSLKTNVPRSNLIVFESMLRMKELGCTEYDMIGYSDDRYETEASVDTRSRFKASFRPDVRYVTPQMVKPLRPLSYMLVNRARDAYRKSKSYKRLKQLLHGEKNP